MNRSFLRAIALVAVALASSIANAQRVNELATGVRVRLTPAHGHRLVGALAAAPGDSLSVMVQNSPPLVRSAVASDVKKVEVSNGKSRAQGALIQGAIGLGIGAVSGAILGAATYSDPSQSTCNTQSDYGFLGCGSDWCLFVCSRGQAAGLGGVLGGFSGLVIGTIVGIATGHESWTTVPP